MVDIYFNLLETFSLKLVLNILLDLEINNYSLYKWKELKKLIL